MRKKIREDYRVTVRKGYGGLAPIEEQRHAAMKYIEEKMEQ
jgi:hypothetical protein